MALVTKPPALDESINTTELSPRNVADVLAQELSGIAAAIGGGTDKVPKTDIATVEPTNVASRAYNIGELVYVNGNLYKVIAAISGGATFTVGTNIQSTNVSGALNGMKVKEGIVNGTTDPVGNIVIALSNANIVVLAVMINAAVICFPFIYATGDTYAHVTSTDGLTPITNTALAGKFYYIEK